MKQENLFNQILSSSTSESNECASRNDYHHHNNIRINNHEQKVYYYYLKTNIDLPPDKSYFNKKKEDIFNQILPYLHQLMNLVNTQV